ncbi:MAG: hypothetical protein WD960_14175 [Gemmatimonadota bacterium]
MPGRPAFGLSLALASLCFLSTPLAAQDAGRSVDADTLDGAGSEVHGIVVDAVTGVGIPEVTILFSLNVPGSRPFIRTTDAEGRFVIVGPAAGLYDAAFMRMGYRAVGDTVRFGGDGEIELVAELLPEAIALDPVVVTAESVGREVFRTQMDGFFERMRSFPGDFFTRADIDRIDPDDITQLLVQVGPFRQVPGAPGGRARVLGRGGCAPSYYLNGAALTMSPVDMLAPDDLEAMEVYRGSFAPAEFQTAPAFPGEGSGMTPGSCGTVVLWTQDGERSRQASTAAPTARSEGEWAWMPVVWIVAATTGTYLFGR